MDDLHLKFPHRWITPNAKSFNSNIHGLGATTIKSIKKAETIAFLGGIIIPRSEIKKYWDKMGHVGIQIDDEFFICPPNREELIKTGVFNHSCEPNCGISGNIKIIAIRDIKPGEELTFDYAFTESFFEPFKCNCRTLTCRKVIKPDDWKDLKLQRKFYKYFSDYLRNKMRSRAKFKYQ